MKNLFIFFLLTLVLMTAQAQKGDFAITLSAPAETVALNGTTTVIIHACNNGTDGSKYVANSLRITLSVGPNAEIMGVNNGSDARWGQLSLTTGADNTIRLTNSGGTILAGDCGDINLTVRGAVAGITVMTCNITFIAAINPLLGAPNAIQGNASTSNDNSLANLVVTATPAGVLAYPNPARDMVSLAGITAGSEIVFTDLYGNILQTQKANGSTVTINIGQYTSGQYMVNVINGNTKKTIKVSKQ